MDSWPAIWLIIFALGALLYFGTAFIITVAGMRDLKDLLSKSKRGKQRADR